MKTLPILAFLAALVAFVVSSLPFELASSILFVTGLTGILAADYTSRPRVAVVCMMAPDNHRKSAPAFELAA